jgi:hypothetical protein
VFKKADNLWISDYNVVEIVSQKIFLNNDALEINSWYSTRFMPPVAQTALFQQRPLMSPLV